MDMRSIVDMDPLVADLAACREIFWENLKCGDTEKEGNPIVDIADAEARLLRFAPFIERKFPQVKGGLIESPLTEIASMKEAIAHGARISDITPVDIKGRLFLKCDSHLPISGSIKARGGIYEVLKLAEGIALKQGLLTEQDNYGKLADETFRRLFSNYKVAVGSTGNLGLSIGIISAAIGFQVTVHMSADARQWKKALLRSKGVTVVEYPDDYEAAVAQGRQEASEDASCHFVDDENSLDLFAGYSVAGKRLKKQLEDAGIKVDEEHRLYVYLPCGVGGAPGGVTYGLKHYFGENVCCFFAEPTHAPCMTLGLVTGLHNRIAVGDIGIDGRTEADGLAVGRPSGLVSAAMESRISGCFTVKDEKLYPYLAMLQDTEDIFVEPSACAAFDGLQYIHGGRGRNFPLPDENSIHIVWATGGEMVPEEEKSAYYAKGRKHIRK